MIRIVYNGKTLKFTSIEFKSSYLITYTGTHKPIEYRDVVATLYGDKYVVFGIEREKDKTKGKFIIIANYIDPYGHMDNKRTIIPIDDIDYCGFKYKLQNIKEQLDMFNIVVKATRVY